MSEGKFFICDRVDDHGDDGATFYCDKCPIGGANSDHRTIQDN